MSVYLTSDLHFGHALVSGLRGFTNTDDHDDAVMASLSGLGPDDQLWILGDLAVGVRGEQIAFERLATLPCTLHLIEGNHDRVSALHRDSWKHQRRFLELFSSVQAYARRRGPGRSSVLLSHYPYQGDHTQTDRYSQYRLVDEGLWLCHGHTHQSERRSGPRQIHVGWDAWRRPVLWDEVLQLIEADGPSPM